MKKSRFTGEQVTYAPRLADSGKKRYANLSVSELRKLKQFEDENVRLRRIVADLTLDKQILQKVVRKNCEGSQAARAGILTGSGWHPGCAAIYRPR